MCGAHVRVRHICCSTGNDERVILTNRPTRRNRFNEIFVTCYRLKLRISACKTMLYVSDLVRLSCIVQEENVRRTITNADCSEESKQYKMKFDNNAKLCICVAIELVLRVLIELCSIVYMYVC